MSIRESLAEKMIYTIWCQDVITAILANHPPFYQKKLSSKFGKEPKNCLLNLLAIHTKDYRMNLIGDGLIRQHVN